MTENILFSPKNLSALLIDRKPCAHADLFGPGGKKPIRGSLSLYATPLGILIKADFVGLPESDDPNALSVCFDGKRRSVTLPCTPGGDCRCLTAAFAIEDVLGTPVTLCSEGCGTPLAVGEIHSVVF